MAITGAIPAAVVRRFHNVPELLNLLSEAWDFVREQT